MSIETEVKLLVKDHESLKLKIEKLGATLHKPRVFERNVRYENTDKTLSLDGIVLRLRKDDGIRLTYKEPGTIQNGIMSRYEAEVTVSDFNTMDTILGKLGYYPFMVYEKFRTTYHLNESEIVLDELPYGYFMEIEGNPDNIEVILQQLNMQDMQRFPQSYIYLFHNVCKNLQLDFTDLTFNNFSGIDIPEGAFENG